MARKVIHPIITGAIEARARQAIAAATDPAIYWSRDAIVVSVIEHETVIEQYFTCSAAMLAACQLVKRGDYRGTFDPESDTIGVYPVMPLSSTITDHGTAFSLTRQNLITADQLADWSVDAE